ncbi:MAG: CopG family transcriptional regulator [Chloroflexi bacterium]|nr:CopG family transcriptional regulator [Chloroflexota bacterium]
MRRIQLYVDDDVDQVLSAEAARRGTSRSAVIRDAVRTSLNHYFQDEPDPIDALVGWLVDADPVDDIDEVIYGYKG